MNNNNYIKGYCHTNLDDCKKYQWPNKFVAVPQKGDFIESACKGRVLKAHDIKHCQATLNNGIYDIKPGEPYIVVELNK